MSFRFGAHYIFPVGKEPIKNGVICLNDTGRIEALYSQLEFKESEKFSFYDGILIPALIPLKTDTFYSKWMVFDRDDRYFQREYFLFTDRILKDRIAHPSLLSFSEWLDLHTVETDEMNIPDSLFGKMKIGCCPGILYICCFDFRQMNVTSKSRISVLYMPENIMKAS